MQPSRSHSYPDQQNSFDPNAPLLPPPSPWFFPTLPPPPHFHTDLNSGPPRPPRPTLRRPPQRRHQREAPVRRGAAAAPRWEPPPPHEQPGPRPHQRHGAQRGAPQQETGGFLAHRPTERIVEEGPRLRFAQVTNIRVILPIMEVAPSTTQDAAVQCNRPWEDFLEMPLPEEYVLPPTHQGGSGPFIRLSRSPTPPPLIPITWVEIPEPVADPNDLPEYVGLADLRRFQTE